MSHCIADYFDEEITDVTGVWSLREYGRPGDRVRRRATIFVCDGVVEEAAGRGNRDLHNEEVAVIHQWAAKKDWSIASLTPSG